jgi:hypothetical protein
MIGSIILNCRIQTLWILDSSWTLILSKFSGLSMVSESNWILDLDSWILAVPPYFLRCSASILESSLSPTPNGVVGIHQRFRLVRPTSAIGTINQQSPNRVVTHPTKNVIATLTTTQPKEKRYG